MSESVPLCPDTLSLADWQACYDTLSTVHVVILSGLWVPIGVFTGINQSSAFFFISLVMYISRFEIPIVNTDVP